MHSSRKSKHNTIKSQNSTWYNFAQLFQLTVEGEFEESWLDELSRFLWRRLLPLPPPSFVDEVDTDDVLPLLVDDVTVWEDFDRDDDDDDVTVRDDVELDDVERDDVCVVDDDALLSATRKWKWKCYNDYF